MKKITIFLISAIALGAGISSSCMAMEEQPGATYRTVKEALDAGATGTISGYYDFQDLGIESLEGLETIENPEGVTSLGFRGTNLKEIPVGALDRFVNLKQFHIDDSPITEFKLGVFDKLTKLEFIFLNDLPLTSVPDGIFDTLTNLKFLSLRGNKIAAVSPTLIAKLVKLGWIDLGSNELTAIDSDFFKNQPELMVLWLSHNKFETLPSNLLASNNELVQVYLQDNKLRTIDLALFDNKPIRMFDNRRIDEVWLTDNPLDEVPGDTMKVLKESAKYKLEGEAPEEG